MTPLTFNLKTKIQMKCLRFAVVWFAFLTFPLGAIAQAGCAGCNPASKHGIDVCYTTDYSGLPGRNEFFYRGSSSGVDPVAVIARGCAIWSANSSDAYSTFKLEKCDARIPSTNPDSFGGPWGTYYADYTALRIRNSDGAILAGGSSYVGLATCQCNDDYARNGDRVIALGVDGSCYCKLGMFWDDNIRACVPTPPQPILIALIGLSATKALPAGPALLQTAKVSQNGIPLGGKSVSISVQGAGGSSALSGLTDGSGNFQFTYIPPNGRATQDAITATCSDCSNTATNSIDVTAIAQSCPREPGDSFGNPISAASGSKRETAQDYTGAGPHPLSLTRYYASSANSGAAAVSGLGGTWSHSWAGAISASALSAVVTLGDGSSAAFSRIATDQPWLPNSGTDALLSNANSLTYARSTDESRYTFNATAGTTPRLVSITQRNGWMASLAYNAANRLASATNAFGHVMAFSYNSAGQLVSMTPPDGQPISYTYDTAQRLANVGFADQTTHTYHYEDSRFPPALTGVTREDGVRYSTFSYNAYGQPVGTSHAGNTDGYTVTEPGVTTAPSSRLVAGSAVDPAIYRSTAQVTDPLGNQQTWVYQGGDGQVWVLGANQAFMGGEIANRSFGQGSSLPTSETDFLGVQTMYTWDLNRQLKTATTQVAGRPEAQTSSTQWHPTFRLPALVTEAGRTTAYTYDALGNKLTEVVTDTTGGASNGQARTWAWTYNPQGLVATSTDPRGKVTAYAYDAAGNLSQMTNPLGHVSSYLYDGAGRITRMTERNGLQTSMAYDARGRLTQSVRGGNLALALQQKTVYTFTLTGQVASALLPNGYQVTYSYDAAQRLTGALDNRGNRISYTLDAMGNRVREEVKDASNQIALVTSRIINSLNRVSAIQGSVGQTTQLSYDANGEPVQSTDPLNQTTRQTLDGLRRTVVTTFADNAQASSAYNALNQITQAVDPKAVATVYVKNAWGEVLTETSPDSGTTQTTRDLAGNALTSTDARGNTTQYQYDNAGRVTQVTQADGKLQLFSYDGTAAGDQLGYLREMTDTSGTTRYERDAFGRITKKTQVVLDNTAAPTTLITRYTYTPAGDVAAIRYPSGLQVNYARNTTGQISGITTQAPSTAAVNPNPQLPFISALSYTALQQPQSWQWSGMGTSNTAVISTASRSFDADGHMTANQVASYTYDAASRITTITQNLFAQRTVTTGNGTATTSVLQNYSTPATWQVGYDSRNRVVSFTRTDSGNTSRAGASYTYDPNSNRLSAVNRTTTDTDKDGLFEANEQRKTAAQTLSIGAGSNKLLGFTQVLTTVTGTRTNAVVNSQVNYTLDPAGNLLSDGLRSFAYDTTNRLSTVTLGSTFVGSDTIAGNELASQSYLHNALGQRVFKSEPRTQLSPPNSSTLGPDFVAWLKNNFSWLWATAQTNATLGDSYNYGEPSAQIPSWALLGEYGNGGASSTGRTEYIWLPTEDGNAIPVGMYRGGKFYAIHTDHLGTPRLIADNTNQPVWQWAYSAFGDNAPTGILKPTTNAVSAYLSIPATAGSGTTTATLLAVSNPGQMFNLRFQGQFADSETGNFYNYFRNYQPNQGRYTQGDPIGLAGGINRFGYVGGNAVSYTDPLGLRRGGNGKGAVAAPTIGAFGCVFGACASSNNLSSDAQLSFELTLGGGLEICDAPVPKPESQSCEKTKSSTVIDPGGPPIPKKFGGAFFGVGIKSDGSFCVRVGPHVSVPFAPSLSRTQ